MQSTPDVLGLAEALLDTTPLSVETTTFSRIAPDTAARRWGQPLRSDALLLASGGSSGHRRWTISTTIRAAGRLPRAARLTSAMDWQPGQRQLVIGPLDHAAPLTFFFEGLLDDNDVHVMPEFSAPRALDVIEQQGIRWMQVTPLHLQRLAAEQAVRPRDLSSLRAVVHTSAACPPALKRHWHELVGPEHVYEMYGNTEGIGVSVARGDVWAARPGTVGRGFFCRFEIRDDGGFPVAADEIGNIYVRRADAHQLHTDSPRIQRIGSGLIGVGDRGHLDTDGFLYLAPRQLSSITIGAETFLPAEVEEVLGQHPDVFDVGVTDVIDGRSLHRTAALVVPRPGASFDAQSFRSWARQTLRPAARPRHVVVVEQIPRTTTGKIDRAELHAEAATAVRRAAG